MIKNKKFLTILVILGLAFALIAMLKMAGQSQDIRNKAAGSTANLVLSPNTEVFKRGEIKNFDVQTRFSGGSTSEIIGYFQTEITFDKNLLNVTPNDSTTSYIDTSTSGLGQVILISTGSEANANGKIIIKLGAVSKTAGPNTSDFITTAKIKFIAVGQSDVTDKDINIPSSEIAYNTDPPSDMTVANVGAKYSISGDLPTSTPTVTPPRATSTPTVTLPGATSTPFPTTAWPTPTPTSSFPTPTPTMYQVTIPPTPPSDRDKYLIDIGNKQSLTIQIGPGNGSGVQIKFKAKLANVQGHPDLLLKLRAKDELAFLNNPQNEAVSNDSCNNPPSSVREYLIPVKADANGIYAPAADASPYAYTQNKNKKKTAEASNVIISSDGWVTLDGLYTDRYYSLFLKAPKTRSTREVEHVIWNGGSQSLPEFDWTSDDLALQPGDLQDPNNNYAQNCTVNSIDLSLIEDRLGNTDPDALRVADVNYDGVVNGNDISKVVNTLSTKPDDDH